MTQGAAGPSSFLVVPYPERQRDEERSDGFISRSAAIALGVLPSSDKVFSNEVEMFSKLVFRTGVV